MQKSFNWYVEKINRASAWILLVTIVVFIFTGYGMTKGWMDVNLATNIHLEILPKLLVVVFSIHTFCAIRMAFKRWQVWDGYGKLVLIMLYLVFGAGLLFADKFSENNLKSNATKPTSTNSNTITSPQKNEDDSEDDDKNSNTIQNNQQTSSTNTGNTSAIKTFTVNELAQYNGKNGQPAYVAIDGDVYDVTTLFYGGFHHMHLAGQDLTNAFYSRHAKSKLSGYTIVGKLQ